MAIYLIRSKVCIRIGFCNAMEAGVTSMGNLRTMQIHSCSSRLKNEKESCHLPVTQTGKDYYKQPKFICLNTAPALTDLKLILNRRQNLIMRELQMLNEAEALFKEIQERLIIIKSRTNNSCSSKPVRNRSCAVIETDADDYNGMKI
ncbi:hypothetical protein Ocin01_09392 [Orchesella cincta]|uniref:Uncharacterized protein n=1 Tax=Orchesella cincta TaxID=48709 RepID=A0A1D2MWF3_ORCCI|nr:hypothetical protein Ocin01_09392 [Orchesella cincta]